MTPPTYLRLCRAFLYALLLCACYQEAKADTVRWQLRLGEYTSAKGHRLDLGSFVAYLDEGLYPTEDACEDAGDAKLSSFHGSVLPDGSRVLAMYWCERVKA